MVQPLLLSMTSCLAAWGEGEDPLYESLDLDDFGENARIGRNGEFYLKDVIGELEF